MKLQFSDESLRRKIPTDPDDEPTAGGPAPNPLAQPLRDLMAAYERRVRSDCAPEWLHKEPWRCLEYIAAEQALQSSGGQNVMKRYTMTAEQFAKIVEACQSMPLIALQCGMPSSPQERANDAWKELAKELGFRWDSVRPVSGEPHTVFDAEPLATADNLAHYETDDTGIYECASREDAAP
jgi:hypothetical protein